jgi:hypothetical protein
MANAARPLVSVTLDKERHLLMNINAMVAFEEATGKSLFDKDTAKRFARGITAKDLRALLWACLIHEDPGLTTEKVGGWIDLGNMAAIAAKVGEAWKISLPQGADKSARPLAKKPRAG